MRKASNKVAISLAAALAAAGAAGTAFAANDTIGDNNIVEQEGVNVAEQNNNQTNNQTVGPNTANAQNGNLTNNNNWKRPAIAPSFGLAAMDVGNHVCGHSVTGALSVGVAGFSIGIGGGKSEAGGLVTIQDTVDGKTVNYTIVDMVGWTPEQLGGYLADKPVEIQEAVSCLLNDEKSNREAARLIRKHETNLALINGQVATDVAKIQANGAVATEGVRQACSHAGKDGDRFTTEACVSQIKNAAAGIQQTGNGYYTPGTITVDFE